MKKIWDGKGLADGQVFFVRANGEIVGRPYVRDRVRRHLARWSRTYSVSVRNQTLTLTVDDDAWLGARNQQTVSSLCRDAENVLLRQPLA